MATGLRIMAAPEFANKTIVIQDPGRHTSHNGQPKVYAIPLNGEASAIVSETVWERLQAIAALCPEMPTLVLAGDVASPPTMRAGEGRGLHRPTVLWAPNGELADIAPLAVPQSF